MYREQSEIEGLLIESYRNDLVLVIKLKLEQDLIVTAVESFLESAETKIVKLKRETLYGYTIDKQEIFLSEIDGVIPLYIRYSDQFYLDLRRTKK